MKRLPRITLGELLLLVALCALVIGYRIAIVRGWATSIVTHVEFSPDGQRVAAVYHSGLAVVWDVSDPHPRVTAETQLDVHGLLPAVRWARVGGEDRIVYAVGRWGGTTTQLRLWDPNTGRHSELTRVSGYVSAEKGLVVRGGRLVFRLLGSKDGYFVVDLATGELGPARIGGNSLLDVSPDGRYYAVESGGISVMVPPGGMWTWDNDGAEAARFSADGQILVLRAFKKGPVPRSNKGDRYFVRAYEMRRGTRLWEIETESFGAWSRGATVDLLRLTPDGKQVVVVRYSDIDVFDVATGERVATVDLWRRERFRSPWGRWWSRRPLFALGIVAHHDWISVREALSPDGRLHARGTRSRPLTVCEIATGKHRTLSDSSRRWVQPAIFAVGFLTWAVVWGLVRRRKRRGHWTGAGAIMAFSGIFLIIRGIAIGFKDLEDFGGAELWLCSLLCLGIGVYSIAAGVKCDYRSIVRVAIMQLFGVLFCDVWLCLSAAALLSFWLFSLFHSRAVREC